jgi:hypothetical protein
MLKSWTSNKTVYGDYKFYKNHILIVNEPLLVKKGDFTLALVPIT